MGMTFVWHDLVDIFQNLSSNLRVKPSSPFIESSNKYSENLWCWWIAEINNQLLKHFPEMTILIIHSLPKHIGKKHRSDFLNITIAKPIVIVMGLLLAPPAFYLSMIFSFKLSSLPHLTFVVVAEFWHSLRILFL